MAFSRGVKKLAEKGKAGRKKSVTKAMIIAGIASTCVPYVLKQVNI